MIDYHPKILNSKLTGQIEEVLAYLLPNGQKHGGEYTVGSINGEQGKSLSVRIRGANAGIWKDFADDSKGGDLLDLWSACRGLSFFETITEVKEYLGIEETPKFNNKKKYTKPKRPTIKKVSDMLLNWFSKRGISQKTIIKLKVAEYKGAIVFPYISPSGELELIKYRSISEKKFWSNENPIPCLFGWQSVVGDTRDIVICEGEIDCLTLWEQGIPALSIPKGAGGGGKQDWIEYEYKRLQRFDKIYICMDTDDAGRIAKVEIINRLGRDRCYIVELGKYKDPNEVHLSGVFISSFLKIAQTKDPDELKRLSDFHDDILYDLENGDTSPGLKLPWLKAAQEVKFRPGEITVWAGINSHGKSVLVSHIIADGVSQGYKFCVASMEMPPADFGSGLYRQIGWSRNDGNADKIKEFIDNGIWIFNSYGVAKADKIIEVFEYAMKRYGINHFVIDSLAKCGFAEDDYSGQKKYVDRLAEFALKNMVHLHLVLHIRKQNNEQCIPGKFDIKGTGAIIDMVSNAFIVWRNKEKEEKAYTQKYVDNDDPDTLLKCVKQRKTGIEPIYKLWFNGNRRQFLGRNGEMPKQYIW